MKIVEKKIKCRKIFLSNKILSSELKKYHVDDQNLNALNKQF